VQQALFGALPEIVFEQAADTVVPEEIQHPVVRDELRRTHLQRHARGDIARIATGE
jgi:hypothetical protein